MNLGLGFRVDPDESRHMPAHKNNNNHININEIDPRWGKADPLHEPSILANFQARPTDVLITTAPKAGTTWMQQILHQLRSGGDDSFASIGRVVPWLELPHAGRTARQILHQYEQLENPRVFKTHCTFEQTPGIDTAKIILTSRDPRDCCISFYHHILDMIDEAREEMGIPLPNSLDEFLDSWLSFGSWFRNVSSWWPHRQNPRILWLRYEDLKIDLNAKMQEIIDYLGWQINDDDFEKAVTHSSFTWMKANADRFVDQFGTGKAMFKPGGFIRKGIVGDGKSVLSSEQEQRIIDKAKQTLTPDCLEYFNIQ